MNIAGTRFYKGTPESWCMKSVVTSGVKHSPACQTTTLSTCKNILLNTEVISDGNVTICLSAASFVSVNLALVSYSDSLSHRGWRIIIQSTKSSVMPYNFFIKLWLLPRVGGSRSSHLTWQVCRFMKEFHHSLDVIFFCPSSGNYVFRKRLHARIYSYFISLKICVWEHAQQMKLLDVSCQTDFMYI